MTPPSASLDTAARPLLSLLPGSRGPRRLSGKTNSKLGPAAALPCCALVTSSRSSAAAADAEITACCRNRHLG
jgi:hypothetical protein